MQRSARFVFTQSGANSGNGWNGTIRGQQHCYTCHMSRQLGIEAVGKCSDPAFFETGYFNWKDACSNFCQHEASDVHQELAVKFAHFTSGKSITSQLSAQTAKEQKKAPENV